MWKKNLIGVALLSGLLLLSGCGDKIEPIDQTNKSITEKHALEDGGYSNKSTIPLDTSKLVQPEEKDYDGYKVSKVTKDYFTKATKQGVQIDGITVNVSNNSAKKGVSLSPSSELAKYIVLHLLHGEPTINLSNYSYLKAQSMGGEFEQYEVDKPTLEGLFKELGNNYMYTNILKGVTATTDDNGDVVLAVDYAVPTETIYNDFKNLESNLEIYSTQLYGMYKLFNGTDMDFFIEIIKTVDKQVIKPSKSYAMKYETEGNALLFANYNLGNNPWKGYSRQIMTLAVVQKLYQSYSLTQPAINVESPLWGANTKEYTNYTDIQKRALVSWVEHFDEANPDDKYVYSFALTDEEMKQAGYKTLKDNVKVIKYEDFLKYFFTEPEESKK